MNLICKWKIDPGKLTEYVEKQLDLFKNYEANYKKL